MNRDWRERASCAGMADATYAEHDPFYPTYSGNTRPNHQEAKSICTGCPVTVECLEDENRVPGVRHGFRAGLTDVERAAQARKIQRGVVLDETLDRCRQGHVMDAENTRIRPSDGKRACRACEAAGKRRSAERAARLRESGVVQVGGARVAS